MMSESTGNTVDLFLIRVHPAQKIQTIKVVRQCTGLGLQEALELVEGAPALVRAGVPEAEAYAWGVALEGVGATVELRPAGVMATAAPFAPLSTSGQVDLYLTALDPARKIRLIKTVRVHTRLGLKEAKDLVEGTPAVLLANVPRPAAEAMAREITEAGGRTDILPAGSPPPFAPPQASPKLVKSGCYIATACYGDADHPDVRLFRQFRDTRLLPTPLGRRLVMLYYRHSPALAARLGPTAWLTRLIRHGVLAPLAGWLRKST